MQPVVEGGDEEAGWDALVGTALSLRGKGETVHRVRIMTCYHFGGKLQHNCQKVWVPGHLVSEGSISQAF